MKDKEWAMAQAIIASSTDLSDVEREVIAHAKVVLYLVCHMGWAIDQTEDGIRALYLNWAEMAVEEFRSPTGKSPVRYH